MNTRGLRMVVSGTVLTVALMVSALSALAGHDGTSPAPDNPPTTGFSSDTAAASGDGSLIKWLVGGAVVIVVGGYFFYAKNKKKGIKPLNPAQQDNKPDNPV